jgi:hypothetical protein
MTTDYERGFSAGERKAWEDRSLIRQLVRPKETKGEWERGYMDGYFPRSLTWSLRKPAIRSYAEIDE